MAVSLNHHIVPSADPQAAAIWLAELLGLEAPSRYGPFWEVRTANGVSLDFMDAGRDAGDIRGGHYAFLVSEEDFDAIFGRIEQQGLDYYADPHAQQPKAVNHNDGGRGVYWPSPDGHWLEIITRPYGSGG